MLSPQLRRKVHDLWSLFWSSGLSNPLVAIEQITYLLFIRQLESLDRERVKQGKVTIFRKSVTHQGPHDDFAVTEEPLDECRWSYIRQNPSFRLLNDTVFPWLRGLELSLRTTSVKDDDRLRQVTGRLSDAYFILDVNKTDTLKRAVGLIDELFRALDTRSVNSDIMGDIFEYLLEEVKESGKNGQFRTPRHVIRFMVQLLNPELGKTILDPACGSGGFLLNTLLQWKADHTDKDVLRLEWDGAPHDVRPVWPKGAKLDFNQLFHGYDNDRTMVRIAWMNLILHDLESPEIHQLDALSKRLPDSQSGTHDYILANPPFTGSVDEGDLSENKQRFPAAEKGTGPITTKSELLFVWLMLDLLKIGGSAAVIVPDGVLFGSTNAHRALRRQLLFENSLEAVVSLPANIFQPYSGVKTSILLFQKAGTPVAAGARPRTREVWFYEISDEAFSLDQKRKARYNADNDLWDALAKFESWKKYCERQEPGKNDQKLLKLREASVSTDYHQPTYWKERWRSVDDDFLKIFPEKSGDKGHTLSLHQIWPEVFSCADTDTPERALQYDDIIVQLVRSKFEQAFKRLVQQTVSYAYAEDDKADNALVAAERIARALASQLTKKVRDEGLLDREFDQFGLTALKAVLKEMSAKVSAWAAAVAIPDKKAKTTPIKPDVNIVAETLVPELKQFAKLDGYDVWRRNNQSATHKGKLAMSDEGAATRQPTLMSWIVPVRQWAERDNWGEDPKTKELVAKPTHKNGAVDPAYLVWLRDTLKIYDQTDATVKPEHRDRLDPDCLEFLDFNLSAGRHKPFVFDAGQHRPPAELIGELQAVHSDVQKRLGKLLTMVEGAK